MDTQAGKTLIALLVAGTSALASAGVIFSTDFESATQPGGQGTPIDHGGTVSNGFAVSQFTRGAGVGGFRLETNAIPTDFFIREMVGTNPASNLVDAVAFDAYFEFTVEADEPADLGRLKFAMRGHGSGQTGYITARSSVDNYTANLATVSGVMNSEYPATVSLSDAGGFEGVTNVTFRFYVYDLFEGANNRYLGIDDIELALATPPVYGTVLEDGFSAGQGDWATRANPAGEVVFTNGTVRISPNANNGQPSSAYLGFDTVTLLDGETLRLSVDVATDNEVERPRDLRIALGLANPAIEGDSTNIAVPMDGYHTTMPSSGSTTDPRVWWVSADGGAINFFNASTALVGDIPLDDGVSATNTLKTWVFDVARSGNDLVFTGSFDGTAFGGSVTATGAAVVANFKFNTLALGYIFATGQVATYDNVKLERFAASASGFAAWADSYGLDGDDALPGADPDGDGYDNLYEYALGGNPTNSADAGYLPAYGLVAAGGTNWFEFVHARRKNAGDLDYYLELNTDLVYGTWTNAGYVVLDPPGDLDAEFEAVTNRVSTKDEAKQFVRLVVEQMP